MIKATAQGKKFSFPEGTTPEQMGEAIDEYFSNKAKPAQSQNSLPKNQDVPLLPEQVDQLSPEARQQYLGTKEKQEKEFSFPEAIEGVYEVGKTILTGATTGQAGGLAVAGNQAFEEMKAGEFGSYPAAKRIQNAFAEGQETFTDTPESEAGQEILRNTSKALEPISALPPVIPFTKGVQTPVFNYPKLTPKQKKIKAELETNPRNPNFAQFLIVDGKPEKTAALKNASKQLGQGGDEVVAVIKSASPADKKAIRDMVNIVQEGKVDPLTKEVIRVGDVVGNSLRNRVISLKKLNRDAGTRIDNIARSQLKGKKVDLTETRNSFKNSMDDLRVKYNPETGEVDFTGSALEGSGAAASRDLIKRLAVRMKNTEMDAADAHFLKRLIDKEVSFGKSPGGLAGDIDDSVKGLRKQINDSIREISEPYKKANLKYAETITALDNLQKAAGTTLDLSDNKALGVSSRRLTNNTQSRAKLLNSMKEIDSVLGKYGINFKDDIVTQNFVANALEKRFKTQGSTSAEGIGKRVAQEATKSNLQRGAEILGAGADKVMGVSDEKAIAALLEITQ